jgi:hypothetical protein
MIIFNCEKEFESEYEYNHFKDVKDNSSMLAVSMLDNPVNGDDFKFKILPRNRYLRVCSVHMTDHASMMIYDNTSSIYCYGCGFGGSVIDYLVKIYKTSYDDAARILATVFDINIPNKELENKESLLLVKRILEIYKSDLYNELITKSIEKTLNYKPRDLGSVSRSFRREQMWLNENSEIKDEQEVIKRYRYIMC